MDVKDELYIRYSKRCMFTGVKKDLTYHHIDKACDGGPKTIENGAILSSNSQKWLHCHIEMKDIDLYNLCNECLILYKMVMDQGNAELIRQYREEIMPKFTILIEEYNNSLLRKKPGKTLKYKR